MKSFKEGNRRDLIMKILNSFSDKRNTTEEKLRPDFDFNNQKCNQTFSRFIILNPINFKMFFNVHFSKSFE